jgi:hypothetical protein
LNQNRAASWNAESESVRPSELIDHPFPGRFGSHFSQRIAKPVWHFTPILGANNDNTYQMAGASLITVRCGTGPLFPLVIAIRELAHLHDVALAPVIPWEFLAVAELHFQAIGVVSLSCHGFELFEPAM